MRRCRSCGADDCEAKFHECLERDFSDPAFGAVHHLTVGAYMLQHHRYAEDQREAMRNFVLSHLDHPPGDRVRRAIRRSTDGAQRVMRRDEGTTSRPPPGGWSLSIGDVDLTTADAYRASVRIWAETVAGELGADQPPDRRIATE